MQNPPWYVLTGAPSSGKTTLLEELAARGYRTVPEAARFVIERDVAAGRTLDQIRGDATGFQHAVLRMKLEWESALPKDEIFFLDRGIPDTAAYYIHEGISEDEALRVALKIKNYRKVFILDLISKENFKHDGARSESWEGALMLDRLLEEAYAVLGYEVIRVPVLTVGERATFVSERL